MYRNEQGFLGNVAGYWCIWKSKRSKLSHSNDQDFERLLENGSKWMTFQFM